MSLKRHIWTTWNQPFGFFVGSELVIVVCLFLVLYLHRLVTLGYDHLVPEIAVAVNLSPWALGFLLIHQKAYCASIWYMQPFCNKIKIISSEMWEDFQSQGKCDGRTDKNNKILFNFFSKWWITITYGSIINLANIVMKSCCENVILFVMSGMILPFL